MAFTLRWGIIATGGISTRFSQVRARKEGADAHAQDLLVDPATRAASDVAHKIVAVGSRSVEGAQKFIDKLKASEDINAWGVKNGVLADAKAYGKYDDVFADPVSILTDRVRTDGRASVVVAIWDLAAAVSGRQTSAAAPHPPPSHHHSLC